MVKKTYWLTAPGESGAAASVEGADLRDQLVAEGWTETDEPAGNQLVWTRNETHGGWAAFPARVLHVWQARGWIPDVPPREVLDPESAVVRPAVANLAGTSPEPPAEDVKTIEGADTAAASVKGNKRG